MSLLSKTGLMTLAGIAALSACSLGGGGSSGGNVNGTGSNPPLPLTFTVGGTVSGLTGTGLALQNNGIDTQAVAADGAFTFATPVASGSAFSVTIQTQPSGTLAQTCAVTSGSGFISDANIANVAVICAAVAPPALEYRVFQGFDGVHAWEPWRTDGTTAGTYMLQDIVPGTIDYRTDPYVHGITQLNGTSYFVHSRYPADRRLYGGYSGELWKSDGTKSGTTPIQVGGAPVTVYVDNVYLGEWSGPYPLTGDLTGHFAVFNDEIYFSGRGATGGYELWKSNGTDTGTALLKDINPAGDSDPQCFINYSGALYFWANGGLWKTDGANTTLVHDGITLERHVGYCTQAVFNGAIYFGLNDGIHGPELWKYSATSNTVAMVKDINPDNSNQLIGGMGEGVSGFTLFDGELYFLPSGRTSGELWKVSVNDTVSQATNINPTGSSSPHDLVELNGELYFIANDAPFVSGQTKTNFQLWKIAADKTAVPVSGPAQFTYSWPTSHLYKFNGSLYYKKLDEKGQLALWKSDGTTAGTSVLKHTCSSVPPVPNANPYTCTASQTDSSEFFVLNGQLLFITNDGVSIGLWRTDGTPEGTVKIQETCTFSTMVCAFE
jgi:ELWxxDGT repeat protein